MNTKIFNQTFSREQLVQLNRKGIDAMNSGDFTMALDDFLMVYEAPNAGIEGIMAMANIAKIFEVLRDPKDAVVYAEMAEYEFKKHTVPMTDEDRSRNYCLMARLYMQLGEAEKAGAIIEELSTSDDPKDMSEHLLFLRANYENSQGRREQADRFVGEYICRLPKLMENKTKIQGANEMLMFLMTTGHVKEATTMIEIMQPVIDALGIPSYRMMFYSGKLIFDDVIGDAEAKQKDVNTYFQIVQAHMSRTIGGILENVKFNLNARLMEKKQQDMEQENKRLTIEAETDPLTGLPNRRALSRLLDELETAKGSISTVAIEIFDIDYFKQLNDLYGHIKGDEALAATAKVLKEMTNHNFAAFRYGGDEFCILHIDVTREQLQKTCEELQRRIEALELPNANSAVSSVMTISQGVYLFTPSQETRLWEEMFTADRALYSVKQNNRGGICITDELA